MMFSDLLLLLGAFVFLVASLGLLRLPDPLARLHAGTKAASFALLLIVVASAIRFPQPVPLLLCAGILMLIFLTAPIGCHAIARRVVKRQED